jgi:hypothetical protein
VTETVASPLAHVTSSEHACPSVEQVFPGLAPAQGSSSSEDEPHASFAVLASATMVMTNGLRLELAMQTEV